MSEADAEDFLRMVFFPSTTVPGYLTTFELPSTAYRHFLLPESFAEGLRAIQTVEAQGHDVYIGCCLLTRPPPGGGRGKTAHVGWIPGFWLDLDILGPAHDATDLPATVEQALEVLEDVKLNGKKLEPTIVVHSGNGLHLWWLFDTPQDVNSFGGLHRAEVVAKAFQRLYIQAARQRGWRIDNTGDLARVLRVPGTRNWKDSNDPKRVEMRVKDGPRYSRQDLCSVVGALVDATPSLIPPDEEDQYAAEVPPPRPVGGSADEIRARVKELLAAVTIDESDPVAKAKGVATKERVRRCLAGEVLCPPSQPGRGGELLRLCGRLGTLEPDADVEILLPIVEPSLKAMRAAAKPGEKPPPTEANARRGIVTAQRSRRIRRAREEQLAREFRGDDENSSAEDEAELPGPVDDDQPEVLDEDKELWKLSDLGNANKLVRKFGNVLRWVPSWGMWFVWDKTRWRKDETLESQRLAVKTILEAWERAKQAHDHAPAPPVKLAPPAKPKAPSTPEQDAEYAAKLHEYDEQHTPEAQQRYNKTKERKEWLQQQVAFLGASQNQERIETCLKSTRARPGVVRVPEQFDSDPMLFNVANGTLDLRTGELKPHRREDYITRVVPARYDPSAQCPRWRTFLEEVLPDDQEGLREYFQVLAGYCLTGLTTEHKMFVCWGEGANGKSTAMETLRQLYGQYGTSTPSSTFLASRNESIRNDIAGLAGARFVTCSETGSGRNLDEALIKQATGGDVIKARFLRQEFFEFKPQLKLLMITNHMPMIRGQDDGIWRRVNKIPFVVQFMGDAQDKQLGAKLTAELPGILNWALEGCLRWQQGGLPYCKAVEIATEEYRKSMDPLEDFFEARVEMTPTATVLFRELYNAYTFWCETDGRVFPLSTKAFSQLLRKREIEPWRDPTSAKGFKGLRLVESK